MENMTMDLRLDEIRNAFVEMLTIMKQNRLESYRKRKPLDWSQENARIDGITVFLGEGHVAFTISVADSYYRMGSEIFKFDTVWQSKDAGEFDRLTARIRQMIEENIAVDTEYLYSPAIYFQTETYTITGQRKEFRSDVIRNKDYEEYVQLLRELYDGIMDDSKAIEEVYNFRVETFLRGLLWFVDGFGYGELQKLVVKIYTMSMTYVNGDFMRHSMEIILHQLCDSIKDKTGRNLNEEEQDMFNFAGEYMLKTGNSRYGKQMYSLSAACGNEYALEKLGKKKKTAKKTKKKIDSEEQLAGILRQYITVVGDNMNIENICPDDFSVKKFRSCDQAIAMNAIKHPNLHPLMREAVEAVITATGKGQKTMWEDDQEQTGGAIARELALHNQEDVELYARYVSTNDMDHPVYQYDDMVAIVEKWGVGEETYSIMAVNGLINQGQHGDEFIEEYKEELVELLKDPEQANAFLTMCAKGYIEEWNSEKNILHDTESVDTLFSELFGTPYYEDFYEENDDFEPGEEFSASARGFVAAVAKKEYPTYEYLMSLEQNE